MFSTTERSPDSAKICRSIRRRISAVASLRAMSRFRGLVTKTEGVTSSVRRTTSCVQLPIKYVPKLNSCSQVHWVRKLLAMDTKF